MGDDAKTTAEQRHADMDDLAEQIAAVVAHQRASEAISALTMVLMGCLRQIPGGARERMRRAVRDTIMAANE